jgi:hypothetical protein
MPTEIVVVDKKQSQQKKYGKNTKPKRSRKPVINAMTRRPSTKAVYSFQDRARIDSANSLIRKASKGNGFLDSLAALRSTEMSLLRSLAMPSDSDPIRVPVGACAPTAVSKPYINLPIDFSLAVTEPNSCAAGETMLAISRDPLHAFVHLIRNQTFSAWTQVVTFNTVGLSTTLTMGTRTASSGPPLRTFLPIAYATVNSGNIGASLSDVKTFGNAGEGRPCLFINGTATRTTTVTLTNSVAAYYNTSDGVIVEQWLGSGWVPYASNQGTGSSNALSITINSPGYYSFCWSQQQTSTADPGLGMTLSGTSDFWAIEPIPGMWARMSVMNAARITSTAMLVSNRAPEMYEGGQIVGAQLSPGTNLLAQATVANIQSAAGSYEGDAKKGIYAYHRCTDIKDFALARIAENYQGTIIAVNLPDLDPPGGWLATAIHCPVVAGAATAYPGANYNFNVFWHVEYSTIDTWTERFETRLRNETFLRALDDLRRLKQFHENPLHWTDVMKFIKQVGSKFTPLLTAASTAIPALRPYSVAMNAINGLIQ